MSAAVSGRSIAVAGAGIGGMTAALVLARLGYQVSVFEQAPVLQEIGAGIQMGPNAFKLFDMIGIRAALDKVAVFPERYQINDLRSGEALTHIPYGQACIDRFGHPYGVVHRHDLHSILVEASRSAGVEILLQSRVREFDTTGDCVEVRCDNGAARRFDALVGADGINSRIRAQMRNGERDPISPGLFAARAVLRIEQVPEKLRHPQITIWLGADCHVICYPLRAGELFNLAAVFASDSDPASPDWNMRREVERAFAELTPEIAPLLSWLEEKVYRAATERVPITKWAEGSVALLGDAAHAMTQNLAQGGCMAIEDAVILADAMTRHADDIPAAFKLYNSVRAPRATHVQYVARQIGDVLHLRDAEREARNAILRERAPEDNLAFFAWLYEGIEVGESTRVRLRGGS
ncbi:FAD-dependent oxidoreductase [Microbacteriaceae bacterium K1510]|nr:FAD-dependent oxidoreductase [Microbacteriaceae bacterium K1510]